MNINLKAKAATAAASRGAALMDKVRKGWFWDVRVTRLDLSNGCNCIIGQVYGNYYDHAAEVLGTDEDSCDGAKTVSKARRFGFLARANRSFGVDYPLLDQAWANEVRTRRGFKPVPLSNPLTGATLQVA